MKQPSGKQQKTIKPGRASKAGRSLGRSPWH